MRARAGAGFSLYEAIFAMSLIGVVLLLSAGIFREASRILTSSRDSDQIEQAVSQVFAQIRRDAQSAYAIEQPSGPTSSGELEMTRLRPLASQYPWSTPEWFPDRATQSEKVHYTLAGPALVRSSDRHAPETVLSQVQSFSAALPSADHLKVSLSLRQSRSSRILELGVYLPVTRDEGGP